MHGRQGLWASQTADKGTSPYTLTMRSNTNNVVLTDVNGVTIWSTNVVEGAWATGSYLILQDDGNLVVYDGDSDAMWRTGTSTGKQSTDYGTGYALEKGKILDLRIHLNVVYRF